MNEQTKIKTLKVRVKDNKSKVLNNLAFDVNQIWNAANAETSEFGWVGIPGVGFINPGGNSAFDLQKALKGTLHELVRVVAV